MVERELPKLLMTVRFRSPAPSVFRFLFFCAVVFCAGCREYVPAAPVPASAESAVAGEPAEMPAEGFLWPVRGSVISSFGTKKAGAANKGIDIAVPEGADVVASRSGSVSFVHRDLPGFGTTIIVDHGDGFATVYAYLGGVAVQPGQVVSGGQRIASAGRGARSRGAVVHFEIRRKQKPQNPFYYLP